jgi:prevent-host-death family protein
MEMSITATEFKARCLELMDRVYQTGESIIITKRGKPISRLAPPEAGLKKTSFLGCMEGQLDELAILPPEYSVFNIDDAVPARTRLGTRLDFT